MRNGGGSQICPADRSRPRNSSERAFCRRHRTAGTVVNLYRSAQRAPERLEHCFTLVVRIHATQIIHMDSRQGMIDETLEKLTHQIDVKLANPRPREIKVETQARAPGEIYHHPRKRLIKRHVGVAIAAQPFLVAQCFGDSLPERDPHIFNCVMRIDMQITLRLNLQVDQPMAGDLVQHVVQKRHAGRQPGDTSTVQIDSDRDLRLKRIAIYFRLPHGITLCGW